MDCMYSMRVNSFHMNHTKVIIIILPKCFVSSLIIEQRREVHVCVTYRHSRKLNVSVRCSFLQKKGFHLLSTAHQIKVLVLSNGIIKTVLVLRWCAITEPEFWPPTFQDPLDFASGMSTSCPRVLKTHLSFDMLPYDVMKKNNKVKKLRYEG